MSRRIVIKLGSQIVTEGGKFAKARLANLISECVSFHQSGIDFLFVTSGAVALGRNALNLDRSLTLSEKQACAAVGQSLLMDAYRKIFEIHDWNIAQLLLTADDFSLRNRYLNMEQTLHELLSFKVAPLINENDTVSTMELGEGGKVKSFGDNDKLSALVAGKLGADLLIILTDVDGVYTDNPNENPDAQLISRIESFDELSQIKIAGASKLGRGGMSSKIEAARVAAICGVQTMIISGFKKGLLTQALNGEAVGTRILPQKKIPGRKKWIGLASTAHGKVVVNEGAKKALIEKRASLLPSGVVDVSGTFSAGDIVSIVDEMGAEVGRGIVNFSARETKKIKGRHSREIKSLIDTATHDVVIGRDNLVIFEEYQS